MINIKNKQIKKYSVLNNVMFYFKIWIKVYPQFIILIFLAVPLGIALVYTEITIPKLIIHGIEAKMTIQEVLKSLFGVSICMIVANVFSTYTDLHLMAKAVLAKSYLNADMIFKKIFSLNYQKLINPKVQNKISEIKEIMSQGDRGVMNQFGNNIILFLTSFFGIIFLAVDIIKIDTILLALIIVTGCINFLYGIYENRHQSKNIELRSVDSKKSDYITVSTQKYEFLKDIKIYNMEKWLTESFDTYRKRWSKYILKSENIKFGAVLINALMVFIRDIFIYIYLINELLNKQIKISYFVFMIGLVVAFSNWFNDIVNQVNDMILLSVQINHIRDFINIDEDKPLVKKSPEVVNKPEIEFKAISYKYPQSEQWIFKNFNLKISAGEKLALVGVNGSGKTTLMLLLMGFLEASEGEILIDGKSSKKFNKSDYYQLFSPVFQDINVFPESIYSNIAGSLEYDKKKADDVIIESGMSNFINFLPNKGETFLVKTSREGAVDLSGGQNQSMLLARALYKNAKINILDEPTSALDPILESKIYKKYNKMSENKTSIFISHRLASTKFCDRIILIEEGKIVEEGTHIELIKKSGRYKEMFDIQSRYYKEEGVEYEK